MRVRRSPIDRVRGDWSGDRFGSMPAAQFGGRCQMPMSPATVCRAGLEPESVACRCCGCDSQARRDGVADLAVLR
jgi:hypothetical protein